MYVIGLDIGTTGTKALLMDDSGAVLGKGYQGYALLANGSHVEQDANEWVSASVAAIRAAISGNEHLNIEGISVSSQGASMAAVDRTGKPIGNALTWMDTRATAQAASLEHLLGNDYVYHMSGWRIFPTLDAAKILHLRESNACPNAAKYLSTIEIVNEFLTGRAVIDPTNAAIRQLFDIQKEDWDERMLAAVGITRDELPEIQKTASLVGGLTAEAAKLTGLKEGTPVYSGAHDQYCASIGAAAITAGDMLLSAGTTWVVLGLADKPVYSKSFIASSIHPVDGLYGAMASLSGSGVSLEWYKSKFLPGVDYRSLDAEAEAREIGDLFFYPYPLGAAYPLWNSNARAAFTGVTLEHDPYAFTRAILEGVAFGVRRTLTDFAENGCSVKSLKVIGGAAKSALWTSLICDITNVPLELMQESDACALGAAVIAAVGAGAFASYRAATDAMVHRARIQQPEPERAAYYAAKYGRFCSLWDHMSPYYR